MSLHRALTMVLPACALALACNNNPPSGGATSASAPVASTAAPLASVTPSASVTPKAAFAGMRAGMDGMFFHATDALTLKPEQKTKIEGLEKDLKTDDAGPRTEIKDLHTDILAQVKAGKIDPSKLTTRYDAIEKSSQAQEDKQADALNSLHATLDATQRKAVTADIRAKQTAREEHMKAKEAPKPEEWQQHRLDKLTKDLDLDDAQQKKVKDLLAKDTTKPADIQADMKKRQESLLTAFEGDTFDAKKQDAFSAKKMRAPMEKEVTFLGQLLPILKPEQKDKLAAKMEHPAQGMMGMHGGPENHSILPMFDEPHVGDEPPAAKP